MNILSLTLHFILKILAFIHTSIGKNLDTLTMPLISMPLTVISLSTVIHHNAISFSLSLNKLSIIDCLFVLFKSEFGRLMESGHVEYGGGEFLKMLLQLLIGLVGIDVGANDRVVAG